MCFVPLYGIFLRSALQFLVLQPHVDRGEPEGSSLKDLAKDPYIILASGSITIGNLGIAMLEPSLPLWMMDTMHAGSATRGPPPPPFHFRSWSSLYLHTTNTSSSANENQDRTVSISTLIQIYFLNYLKTTQQEYIFSLQDKSLRKSDELVC